mgnify:CR=1 FL=1
MKLLEKGLTVAQTIDIANGTITIEEITTPDYGELTAKVPRTAIVGPEHNGYVSSVVATSQTAAIVGLTGKFQTAPTTVHATEDLIMLAGRVYYASSANDSDPWEYKEVVLGDHNPVLELYTVWYFNNMATAFGFFIQVTFDVYKLTQAEYVNLLGR